MSRQHFEDLKKFDFKTLFSDLNVEMLIEQEENNRYTIKLITNEKVIADIKTEPLVSKMQSGHYKRTSLQELEMYFDSNSKYIKETIRNNLYTAWYDIAINSKNKPEYLNPLLSEQSKKMALFKSIEQDIDKQITENKEGKESGVLINQIGNLIEFSTVNSGKDLNDRYDTNSFNNAEYYLKIQLSILDKDTSLFLREDFKSATGYRGFIGVEKEGVFCMKEDISYSKEDSNFNKETLKKAMSIEEETIDKPAVKNKMKNGF